MDILEKRIEIAEIEFSVRAANVFIRNDIKYLDELCAYTPKELMKIRNLGKMVLREIREVLKNYGWNLKEDKHCEKELIKSKLNRMELQIKYLSDQIYSIRCQIEPSK